MGAERKISVAVVSLLLLAVCAVAAVAQEGPGEAPPSNEPVAAIQPEAADAMEVLDQPRASGDAIPEDVSEPLTNTADFGMNPGLSRRAVANVSHSLYVVPADGYVCATLTVGEGANISCAETETIASGESGPATVSLEGGAIAIYGMLPDGVESVSLQTGESNSAAVEVIDNAYYTVVPAGTALRNVSYTGPSGQVEFPIYDPSLVFDEEE
jgi:hypothetical protein